MVKVSVSELEQLLTLIKSTSRDLHVMVHSEPACLKITFENADSQISTVSLYDESTALYAKVSGSEPLAYALNRLKK